MLPNLIREVRHDLPGVIMRSIITPKQNPIAMGLINQALELRWKKSSPIVHG
jgi:hypothetical protein